MQLEDSAAHQGMGGYGVRATARAFDDQHLKASASEQ